MKAKRLHPAIREILEMLRTWQSAKYVYDTRGTTKSSICRMLNTLTDEGLLERRLGEKPARGLQGWEYKLTEKGAAALAGAPVVDDEPVAQAERLSNNPWEKLRYPFLTEGGRR